MSRSFRQKENIHYRPVESRLEGELKGLVGVRGQVDPKDIAWVGLLCHGATMVSKERLREKKKDLLLGRS